MLKAVDIKQEGFQASSLYCQWICVGKRELVAVWIDREMRAFAGETQSGAKVEVQTENLAEEPGGARDLRQTEAAGVKTVGLRPSFSDSQD